MFVEIPASDIHWMEPRDLRFDRMSFRVNDGSGRASAARTGTPESRSPTGASAPAGIAPPGVLRAMLTADGGEVIDEEKVVGIRPRPDPP
jgi:hypothetical protein